MYWRVECHQCLPYTKAHLKSGLHGSCQVSGTMTVREENMESSSIFLNGKQCKINVTSYMTEPTKYTTSGKQHLKECTQRQSIYFDRGHICNHILYSRKIKNKLTYCEMVRETLTDTLLLTQFML